MRAAALPLAALALLLLAAHFVRAGWWPVAALSCALIGLLWVHRSWAILVLRLALLLGTVEWARTATTIALRRAAQGEPYTRVLVILGTVAGLTLAAALLLRGPGRPSA